MRFGVLGWPVAHSRSPAMHHAAYEALGLTGWRYQLLPVPPEAFTETARALGPAGFRGANVTIPHKEAALALADTATSAARAIGAANTLTFEADGTVHAANTDAPGLLAALPASPAGHTALILGAGGSARACAYALREAGAEVFVWNRTADRAERLAGDLGVSVAEHPRPADLLVQCTSVGLDETTIEFKALPVDADALGEYQTVVDLVYRPGGTALIAEARRHGCVTVDGLEILVRQGAVSFEAWTGRDAPLNAMREGARGGPSGHDPRHPEPSSPRPAGGEPRHG